MEGGERGTCTEGLGSWCLEFGETA